MRDKGWDVVFSALSSSPIQMRAQTHKLIGPSFRSMGLSDFLPFLKAYKKIKPDIICVYEGRENFFCRFLPGFFHLVRLRGADRDVNIHKNKLLYNLQEKQVSAVLSPHK